MPSPAHAALLAGYGLAAAFVEITWINSYVDAVDRTTYTFTVDTSTLAAGDYLLINSHSTTDNQDSYLVSVKVDTNATHELVNVTTSGTGATEDNTVSGLFLYQMPGTAATVSVVAVMSVGNHCHALGASRVTGLGGLHPFDLNFSRANAGSLATSIGSCPVNGAIAAGVSTANRPGPTTWAGLTERADFDKEVNDYSSFASDKFTSAQTDITISATLGSTAQEAALAIAGFSPAVVSTWTPASLDGVNLEQWLRADLGLTGSAPVTQWNDQSTNARHMTEATNGPLLVSSAVNSLPALRFDGANDILSCASVTIAQSFSVYLVINWIAVAGTAAPWAGNVTNDNGPAFRTGTGPSEVFLRSNATLSSNGAPIATGQFYVLKGTFNGTSSRLSLNQRRDEINTASLTGSTSSLRLGARNGAGFANVEIAECVIISNPTTRNEAMLRYYFNQRYALWNV